MASSYINNLRLAEMATGDASGTWGTVTNTNLTLIADALGFQSKTVASASTDTLTIPDGTETDNEAISLYVKLTGGNQACTITVGPNTVKKLWIIENATSQVITLTQGSGANVILAAGVTKMIYADGAGSGAALVDALVGLEVGTALYIKNASTGDDSTAQLYLQTAEADIAANDVLGKINFQAPNEGTGTDAILVAAAIQAKSEGDFSSSSNATSLEFMTGASEAAATKMTLTSAGELTVTGKITADAGIDIDNFNIDGTTIALSSGDMTLDAAGDIILDAAGGDIFLKENGTHYGSIKRNNNDLQIHSETSDEDILFVGNDNGSVITALTLDMSDAGTAIFNNKIGIGTTAPLRQLHISNTSANSEIAFTAGTLGTSSLLFGDGLTGTDVYRGYVQYQHNGDYLLIAAAANVVARLDSDGLKFGSDTAAANALDDYEEGNVSLKMKGGNGDPNTQVNVTGTYVKIGRLVSLRAQNLNLNNTGAAGPMYFEGLPFAANGAYGIGSIGEVNDICSFTNSPFLVCSGSLAYVYQNITQANSSAVSHHVDTAGAINLEVTYETNS